MIYSSIKFHCYCSITVCCYRWRMRYAKRKMLAPAIISLASLFGESDVIGSGTLLNAQIDLINDTTCAKTEFAASVPAAAALSPATRHIAKLGIAHLLVSGVSADRAFRRPRLHQRKRVKVGEDDERFAQSKESRDRAKVSQRSRKDKNAARGHWDESRRILLLLSSICLPFGFDSSVLFGK